jgi:hypothetical protein
MRLGVNLTMAVSAYTVENLDKEKQPIFTIGKSRLSTLHVIRR